MASEIDWKKLWAERGLEIERLMEENRAATERADRKINESLTAHAAEGRRKLDAIAQRDRAIAERDEARANEVLAAEFMRVAHEEAARYLAQRDRAREALRRVEKVAERLNRHTGWIEVGAWAAEIRRCAALADAGAGGAIEQGAGAKPAMRLDGCGVARGLVGEDPLHTAQNDEPSRPHPPSPLPPAAESAPAPPVDDAEREKMAAAWRALGAREVADCIAPAPAPPAGGGEAWRCHECGELDADCVCSNNPLAAPPPARGGEASYPCADCGKLRTEAQGGTTFTVCDDCWRESPARGGEALEPRGCPTPGACSAEALARENAELRAAADLASERQQELDRQTRQHRARIDTLERLIEAVPVQPTVTRPLSFRTDNFGPWLDALAAEQAAIRERNTNR